MKKGMNRRNFFKVAATSGAAAALVGCTKDPVETIIPMLNPPTDYVVGKPIYFATTSEDHGDIGIVVKTREGRAIKIEGNPDHPLSQGSASASVQAILQGLYNPNRITGPNEFEKEQIKSLTWKEAQTKLVSKMQEAKGSILYIGKRRTGSIYDLIQRVVETMHGQYMTLDMLPVKSNMFANQASFNKYEIPEIQLEKADLLLNFGADFLESWLYTEKLSRGFAQMHSYKQGAKGKYIHVGAHISQSAANADHWFACPVGGEVYVALFLASSLFNTTNKDIEGKEEIASFLKTYSLEYVHNVTGIAKQKLSFLAKEIAAAKRPIVLAGGNDVATKQADNLQLAVNLLNYITGAINERIVFGADYQYQSASLSGIKQAFDNIRDGKYELVIIENVNPLFSLPKSIEVEKALAKAKYVVSLSTEQDETARKAHLQMPTSHFLESWGDSFPCNGVYSLQQPVMAKVPGYNTKSIGDLMLSVGQELDVLADRKETNYKEYLKTQWRNLKLGINPIDFESFWEKTLQKGVYVVPTKKEVVSFSYKSIFQIKPQKLEKEKIQLLAVNSIFHNANGINGNKSWLLEAPHPLTQLVWGSWVEMNPTTAKKLGVEQGFLVEIKTEQTTMQVGAWLHDGVADNVLIMPTGLGRNVPLPSYISTRNKSSFLAHIERKYDLQIKNQKVGLNPMDLFRCETTETGDLIYARVVTAKGTAEKADLVSLDGLERTDLYEKQLNRPMGMPDRSQKQRDLMQTISLSQLGSYAKKERDHHVRYFTTNRQKNTNLYNTTPHNVEEAKALKGENNTPKYHSPYKFEMLIDLDKCSGCSACVIACQAENNVPVVGKDRVATGREMHWLRIERFIEQDAQTGAIEVQHFPQMCAQCDNAGCETVCPVYATYHTPDGINAMVYNRCVGTRYCANNCVYKQRRFNWRTYEFPKPLHLQLNPDVSVREKGVMEKCNFCYARIREKQAIAKEENRIVYDHEIQPACQQACGANAIIFGNRADSNSQLTKEIQTTQRGYKQLEELNFKPAVTYLKKVKHKKQTYRR